MVNYYRTDQLHRAKNNKEARSKGYDYVMKHKRMLVTITDSNMNLTGQVWYVGTKTGPVYYSEKKDKKYLLDSDGSIYDMKTKKKVN